MTMEMMKIMMKKMNHAKIQSYLLLPFQQHNKTPAQTQRLQGQGIGQGVGCDVILQPIVLYLMIEMMCLHMVQTWNDMLKLLEASLILDADEYCAALSTDNDVANPNNTASYLEARISADMAIQRLWCCTSSSTSELMGFDEVQLHNS